MIRKEPRTSGGVHVTSLCDAVLVGVLSVPSPASQEKETGVPSGSCAVTISFTVPPRSTSLGDRKVEVMTGGLLDEQARGRPANNVNSTTSQPLRVLFLICRSSESGAIQGTEGRRPPGDNAAALPPAQRRRRS